MITIDKVTYRNIQEQVQKNKEDIAAFKAVDQVLIDFGIKVLGQVNTKEEIPEGEYEYGDAYLVGTEEPYDIYIWTRGETPEFIDLGPLAIQGPQGEQGIQGEKGEKGDASRIYAEAGSPSEHSELDPKEGDLYIRTDNASPTNLTKGYIYTYTNNDWFYKGSLRGEVGPQGIRGVPGPRGYTGDVGPMGPQGDPGQSFVIQATLNDPSLLPNPDETQRNYAYVVKTSSYNRLYFITGEDTLIWDYVDMGNVGSTVTENGQEVTIYNADKAKLRTVQFYNPAAVLKDDDLGGYAIVGEGYVETADENVSYNLESSAIVLPLDDTNEITWSTDQSGTKLQAHLAGSVTNKLAKALVTPNSAPSATSLVGIDTSNSQITRQIATTFGNSSVQIPTNKVVYDYINRHSFTNQNSQNSFRVGNLIINFGKVGDYSGGSGLASFDVTFSLSFGNSNYWIIAVPDPNTTDSPQSYDYTGMVKVTNRSKTGCTLQCNYTAGNKRGISYIAIGT